MANYWDEEEWWKRHTATHLYSMWSNATADEEKEAVKKAVVASFEAIEDLKTVSSYDLLSYLKVLEKDELKNEKLVSSDNDVFVSIYDEISRREKELENKEDLVSRLQRKSLLEAARIVKTDEESQSTLAPAIAEAKEKIEQELKAINAKKIFGIEAALKISDFTREELETEQLNR